MKYLALGVAVLLGGCSTSQTANFDNLVTTLHNVGCHSTVNIALNAGAVNPGSGFQAQGSFDCPGATTPAASTPAAPPAAPTASFLR